MMLIQLRNYYRCENDIKLRLNIEEEYGIKALNKDGVNLGYGDS